MEVDLGILASRLFSSIDAFLNDSLLFAFIKFFLFVYCAVLLVDIILLFLMRDVAADLKMTLLGAERPLVKRSKVIRRWEAILSRLESGSESQYKAAVLEADAFADEMLRSMGYKGVNMRERLDQAKVSQLESKDSLEAAHAVRNRVINEESFTLTKEETEACLSQYRRFFDEIELFS
ncbi:MAG: hypothetical protein A2808_00280 [Candidatus Moranbacteria bacterium RIFCSPHIGHO2_01_FULL_55_24]|nr:MAG: hypothetical protein A2808_00280 [Candidatus Moranbacteria bacterium RIFCSPHIGHO2_01_FULL_55_24]